jgi:hypothetical protein
LRKRYLVALYDRVPGLDPAMASAVANASPLRRGACNSALAKLAASAKCWHFSRYSA